MGKLPIAAERYCGTIGRWCKIGFIRKSGSHICQVSIRMSITRIVRMKSVACLLAAVLLASLPAANSPALAGGFDDFFRKFQKALGGGNRLSDDEIIAGLQEALRLGTQNAIGAVSKLNGYFREPEIKIRLPESVRGAEKVLRYAGFGSTVDRFELSMNRAAERAAPQAKSLFKDAIGQLTFTDAKQILYGPDDAATRYFKQKTSQQLQIRFKPIVAKSMAEVGVTRAYRQLEEKLRSISFAQSVVFDLDQYVTEKALDGLYLMLAEEEKKIRQDPAARVTNLLKKVFATN